MALNGVNIRESGGNVLADAYLLEDGGTALTTGTTNVSVGELQSDGTVWLLDTADDDFKSAGHSGTDYSLTHRTKGLWTAIITGTNFVVGGTYYFFVNNTDANPPEQCYKWQFGGVEGNQAEPGDEMDFVDDPNSTAVSAIQNGLATSTEVTAIQNNTRVVRVVPTVIERPDSGTTTYRIELLLYDQTGNMEAPDSAPIIELVDQGGTDLSSRLDSATMALVETGRYRAIYTATDTDDIEQLIWTFSVVEGGNTRKYGNTSLIVDTTAVDFTATDRANLALILGDTDELQQNQGNWLTYDGSDTPGTTTLLSRLTATRAGYLDTINDLADGERLDLLIDFLVDMAEADEYVVTSSTPWQIVYMKKGTGAPGVGTELYRKNMKSTAGADLTSESTVVGQLVEPA